MKYGYARVSTIYQDLDVQLQQLDKENCDKIFSEKYTGTNKKRPEFQKLIGILQ